MCVCIYYFFYILIDFPTRDNTGKHNTNHSRTHTYPRRNKTMKEKKKNYDKGGLCRRFGIGGARSGGGRGRGSGFVCVAEEKW